MTKKSVTIVLVIACVLSIIGAALAAGVWIVGAKTDKTITVGTAITMVISDDSISGNDGLCPGETATITLKADNKSNNAVLKVELTSQWKDYFDVKIIVGESNSMTGEMSINAASSAQDVTIEITLKSTVDTAISGQTVKVTITLDKAA